MAVIIADIMDLSVFKRIILEYQHLTEGIEIVKRDLELDPSLNYVLVGLRRAGKSFILYQQMKELLSIGHTREEFLYLNFEDDRLQGLQIADLDILKQCYEYITVSFSSEILSKSSLLYIC